MQEPQWITDAKKVAWDINEIVYPKNSFAACCAIINVFHLLVLTRKSMRSNYTNVVMVGIAIADLFNMCHIIFQYYWSSMESDRCLFMFSNGIVILREFINTFNNIFRRLSAFLAVLLATIRLLVIRNTMNRSFDIRSTPQFAIKSIAILFFVSGSMDLFYYIPMRTFPEIEYTLPEHCGYPEIYTMIAVGFERHAFFDKTIERFIYLFLLGISKVIPAVSLPILSFLLIREIRKAANARRRINRSQQSMENSKTDQATRMIMYITVASFIAEGPIGVFDVILSYLDFVDNFQLYVLVAYISDLLPHLVILNTMTHCLFSLAVSTMYRDAALSLVPFKKRFRSRISVIQVEPSNQYSNRRTETDNFRY
ncbi:unnamed protein product [Caenorhabditis brenneri]